MRKVLPAGLILATSNFFFGIRTPWTLSSDTGWTRTHRVGGYVMVLIGFLLILAGIVGSAVWGAVAMVMVTIVYSYLIWRAEQHAKQPV